MGRFVKSDTINAIINIISSLKKRARRKYFLEENKEEIPHTLITLTLQES